MGELDCKIIGIRWNYIAEIENVSWPIKELDFKKSNSQIIQMRNGMGKTTTTLLLRHLFSGILPTVDLHQSIFERSVYAGGGKSPSGKKYENKGQISITLEINSQIWEIGLKLDFEKRVAEFFHVHPTEGNRDGWDAPQNFKNLFQDREEFTELFLIDTQEAGSRQTSLNKRIIDGSIKSVTALSKLEDLIYDLEETYKNKIKKLGTDPGKEKLNIYQKAVTKIESLISKKESEKVKLTNDRNNHLSKKAIAEKKLKSLEDKSKFKDELDENKVKLSSAKAKMHQSVNELRESYLNPSNINKDVWQGVIEVFNCLDDLKLPEAVTKHVVSTIREKLECICGQDFLPDSDMDKRLIAFEKDCIDSDVQEEAITIKRTIIDSEANNTTIEFFDDLISKEGMVKNIEKEIKRLNSLLGKDTEERISKLKAEIKENEDKAKEINSKITCLTSTDIALIEANNWSGKAIKKDGTLSGETTDYDNCKNIPTLKKGLKHFEKLRDDIADIHYYNQANNQVISLIEKTVNQTLEELREQVKSSANKHFKPFQSHQMVISSLDDGVKFEDSSGNEKGGANTGAELAAQYSILLSLTEIADVKIPLLIDNPVKGFDGGASDYFDENMSSKVNQLLLVIISGPQERSAIPTIVNNSNSLSTLYRENELVTGKDPKGEPPSGDVIISDDRDWFLNYNPPKEKNQGE